MALREAPEGLPVVRAAALSVQSPEARWLVRDLWGLGAVGILGGSPKVGKSWLGLELATSVAAGVPCLGRFEVEQPGPALVYLAEDSHSMVRARLESLCEARGLELSSLDLHVVTAPALRLDLEEDQRRLQATLATLRPRILLLDPLIRLHRLNENDAGEMSGLLGFLREIQREHDLALVLVHHARKRAAASPGEALRGSGDLHAWTDVTAHLSRREGGDLTLQVEHRAAPSAEPIALRLTSRADGTATHLEVLGASKSGEAQPRTTARLILDVLADNQPRTGAALQSELRIQKQRVLRSLRELEERGLVERLGHKEGWRLRNPEPAS